LSALSNQFNSILQITHPRVCLSEQFNYSNHPTLGLPLKAIEFFESPNPGSAFGFASHFNSSVSPSLPGISFSLLTNTKLGWGKVKLYMDIKLNTT